MKRGGLMEKTSFSNDNSLALKGIAIIMMMFHHCFRATHLFDDFDVSFFPFSQEFIVDVSLMFKICVSIFVFITGYGLTISLKKKFPDCEWGAKQISFWTINRLIKLLSGFWFVAIISYIVCQFVDGRTAEIFFDEGVFLGVTKLLIDYLGLTHLFGFTKFNSTWWYMSIAIVFVVVIPALIKLIKKYSFINILLLIMILPRVIGWQYKDNSFISFFMPLFLGVVFAENDLMVKIANFKICSNIYLSKSIKLIVGVLLLYLVYRWYIVLPQKSFWEIRYGIIPIVIMCFSYEFLLDLPFLKTVLIFLGKHSMNVFLIHTFIRGYYLNEFTYSFKHFAIISLVLLLISLVLSILIELLKKYLKYDLLINKLQNKVSCVLNKLN